MILDFRPRLGNRCIDSGDFRGFPAVILEFRPRIRNRCTDSGDFRGFRAAILEFRPRLGNHLSNGGLQAKLILVAATKIRVGRGTSQQRRTVGETNFSRRNEDQSRTRKHRSNGGLQAKPILFAATKIRIGRGISQQRRLKANFSVERFCYTIYIMLTIGSRNLHRTAMCMLYA